MFQGWLATVQASVPIWDSGAIAGQVINSCPLSKPDRDDDVRQVELEVQTAYSNLQQNQELVKGRKNVELADEALRLQSPARRWQGCSWMSSTPRSVAQRANARFAGLFG
jgi:hypothetical protein